MQYAPDTATPEPAPEARSLRGRSAAFVAERIRERILSGQLPPGERLSERSLTEGLGVTRTPLREAFKILEAEGLLAIVPNRGAQVVELSPADVDMAMELLAGLESVAAELACARGTDEQFAKVAGLHARMVACQRAGDLVGYFRVNQDIHQHIVDCAHNPALSRVYRTESARVRLYRFAGNRVSARWSRAVSEHEQILLALQQRQGPLLRELLRAHHLNGWRVTRKVLENELQPDL
ncbi:GntR family transcriptional regulator [Ancylobacter rudongensis]|uniref:Transcriptional regulator, GntR family n=1 Tax=Ancylobacter rudongensis TaxID=177413 RepID=A0A1G4SIZ2_9HYPH|nr:GntR family transcriptional regulator [Ancylobacter rudongensis]SCW69026.1 transcriptional regulator, GntR family [Ancylobacter rudongensis]